MENKMPKPDYYCECGEYFNRDTEISEGCVECINCLAWNGACECSCDCGQCLYTDTPCDCKPLQEGTCQFCVLRQDWENPLSEVTPILSEVTLKIAQIKDDLNTAHVPGMLSHENLRLRLGRLETCLSALRLVQDKSAWAASIIDEVKNILNLDGRSGVRKYCGLPGCNCHLSHLNDLLEEKMSPEMMSLKQQIAHAAAGRHAAVDRVHLLLKDLEKAEFQKQISREIVDEHKWDGGEAEVLSALESDLDAKKVAQEAADYEYRAALEVVSAAAGKFHRLVEEMKALMA
jgi:hypothetical protein